MDNDDSLLWLIPMNDEEKPMIQEVVLEILCEEQENDCPETTTDNQ